MLQAAETRIPISDPDLLERLQDAERRDEAALSDALCLGLSLGETGLSPSPTRVPMRLKSLTAFSLAYARAQHPLSHALPRSPSRSGSTIAPVTMPRRARKTRLTGSSATSRRSCLHLLSGRPDSPATRHLNGVAPTLAVDCDGTPNFPAKPRQSCVARAPRRDWAPTGTTSSGGGPRGVSRTRALHGQWKSSRRARSRPLDHNHALRTHAQPPR